MTLSKGSLVLVGSAVGIPAGPWLMAYGVVVDFCDQGCHAVLDVGLNQHITIDLTEFGPSNETQMSWENKSIAQMTPTERAAFHTVWASPWVPMEYSLDGGKTWRKPRKDTRQAGYEALNLDVLRRVAPSENQRAKADLIAKLGIVQEQIDEFVQLQNKMMKDLEKLA